MEPWLWEMRRQRDLEACRERMPKCVCCREAIRTERCLSLEELGLKGYVCEDCVEDNMRYVQTD